MEVSLCPCAWWFYIRLETANLLCSRYQTTKDDVTLSLSLSQITRMVQYGKPNADVLSAAAFAVDSSNEFILHHIKTMNFHSIFLIAL